MKLDDLVFKIRHNNHTQKELLKVFKLSPLSRQNDIIMVIDKMDWESINTIKNSELKCVTSKYKVDKHDRYRVSNSKNFIAKNILRRLCALSLQENSVGRYWEISPWAIANSLDTHYPIEFVRANLSHMSKTVLTDYLAKNNVEVTEDIYEVLPKDTKDILNISGDVTKQFVKRLSKEERISILPKLCGDLDEKSNSLSYILDDYAWDSLTKLAFHDDHRRKFLRELYIDCNTQDLKEVLMTNQLARGFFLGLVLEDPEIIKVSLNNDIHHLNEEDYRSVLRAVSDEDKLSIFIKENFQYKIIKYTEVIESKEALLEIFETYLDKFKVLQGDLIERVLDVFKKREIPIDPLIEMVKSKKLDAVRLSYGIRRLLTTDLKEHILRTKTPVVQESWSNSINTMTDFFNGISREVLIECFGPEFNTEYRKYLAPQMTLEEKINLSSDKEFLRHNISHYPPTYIASLFKTKKSVKEFVGDRRDSRNYDFGFKLDRILAKAKEISSSPQQQGEMNGQQNNQESL